MLLLLLLSAWTSFPLHPLFLTRLRSRRVATILVQQLLSSVISGSLFQLRNLLIPLLDQPIHLSLLPRDLPVKEQRQQPSYTVNHHRATRQTSIVWHAPVLWTEDEGNDGRVDEVGERTP